MVVELMGPLYTAFMKIGVATVNLIPHAIAAIIILTVGLVVGKAVARIFEEILARTEIDKYVKVKKAEFRISHVFTVIVKWGIYLVFIQQAADALSITIVSEFVGGIVSFLPGVIKAVFVIGAGYAVARYTQQLVKESDAVYAGFMSKVFFFFVVYIAVAIALPLVGLSAQLVNYIMLIIVASVGLGFAIALGFGMKHAVRLITDELEKKFEKDLKKRLTTRK